MAIPTVSSVTPATGPTLGDMVVSIAGTNFKTASLPPPGQLSDGTFKQTVLVLFDGIPARDAKCFSATRITVIPPQHRAGAVTVAVYNLDANGNPISGEVGTLLTAYTYALPIYTREAESDLARTVRTLLQAFKEQLMGYKADGSPRGDVTYAVQTDYDETTGDELHVTKFASLPGLSLVGPSIEENRFYSINEQPTYDDGTKNLATGMPAGFVETRVPYTVDLLFDVVVASDTKEELLNLTSAFMQFMHRNKFLFVDRANDDPTKGQAKHEFDFQSGGQPKNTTVPNNSNIRSFTARILVRGFDFEALTGIASGVTNGVPNLAIVSKGGTVDQLQLDPPIQTDVGSRIGPSPG